MRIMFLSDLHGHYPVLNKVEYVLIAGDILSNDAQEDCLKKFFRWMNYYDDIKFLYTAGNHDYLLESRDKDSINESGPSNTRFYVDESAQIDSYKVYFTPWQIDGSAMAFTCNEEQAKPRFEAIADDTNILVSHQPQYGYGSEYFSSKSSFRKFNHPGSTSLKERVSSLDNLIIHHWGHVHEGRGIYPQNNGCLFINSSMSYRRDICMVLDTEKRNLCDDFKDIPGLYRYDRIGVGIRQIELLSDYSIGQGAARCETFWRLTLDSFANVKLCIISGLGDVIAELYPIGRSKKSFYGRWLSHEKCDVILEKL